MPSEPGRKLKKKPGRKAKKPRDAPLDTSDAPGGTGQPTAASAKEAGARAPGHPSVVGIGASAGGLAALTSLFSHVPEKTGVAWVVVVHLAPEQKSHLAELLQPHVSLPVQQVSETVELEADRVYVIPPNANLEAVDTHLRLTKMHRRRRERAPIDHFFRTLSATHDGDAVGVVLTGTGSDGTLGLKEIKQKGGLTVVQDPREAEYDAMPQSAIAGGVVDLVLPVAEIPSAILRYVGTEPRIDVQHDGQVLQAEHRRLMAKVFALIRVRTGRDFAHYKPSTIMRRVARRMQLANLRDLADYVALLGADPVEVSDLADELLITVTRFFRDPDVYEILERDVIPELLRRLRPDETLRAWSVGCATGEEAYSVAMLLLEAADRMEHPPGIQIFASDVHEQVVQQAREGFYAGDIESDVSLERLRRFFQKEDGAYRVRKELREAVVFAPHDLLGDPPFSRIDLIVCRNLFIYLQREVQDEVVELFHYALKPEGVLLLGSAERIESSVLFDIEDKRASLYRRRDVPGPEPRLPVFPALRARPEDAGELLEVRLRPASFGELHQRIVERHAPPSVLVGPDDKIVHLSERAGRYLTHPGGELTASMHKLVREELRIELRAALQTARERGQPVRTHPVPVRFDGESAEVVVDVRPAIERSQHGYALVIFDERGEREHEPERSRSDRPSSHSLVAEIEQERDAARQRLQALSEEYDTSREEMRASNEELQSANEELRSTLEELETSKEELQSMNEELQTVNQENRHKVEELLMLSGDLQNLLAATDIATLFLDRDLRILRFTPRVGTIFNVRATDRGRPLSDITHRLEDPMLLEEARRVLDTLVPSEREVRAEEGGWYLARTLPYRSVDDRIEGIVITLIDITSRKEALAKLEETRSELTQELEASRKLHTLMSRALDATDPTSLLQGALRAAISLGNADYGTVQLARDDGTLELIGHDGLTPSFVARFATVTREDDSVCAHALRNRRSLAVGDVQSDDRWASLRDVFAEAGVRAVLSLPLVGHKAEILGVISIHFKRPRTFVERDRRLLSMVAVQSTEIVKRMRREQELRDLATTLEERVEERTREVRRLASTLTLAEQAERRRISQLLHDDLQQLLYGIQVRLTLAQEQAQSGNLAALEAETARSLEQLKLAVARTRRLTVDLSPPVLQAEGFIDALLWIRTQMRETHGLEVSIEEDGAEPIEPRELRLLLFDVVRELLFNVVKHAKTKRATVDVRRRAEGVEVVVSDDGAGFDPARTSGSEPSLVDGLGIVSARERLRLQGGDLEIDAAPGRGTRAVIYAPTDRSS